VPSRTAALSGDGCFQKYLIILRRSGILHQGSRRQVYRSKDENQGWWQGRGILSARKLRRSHEGASRKSKSHTSTGVVDWKKWLKTGTSDSRTYRQKGSRDEEK
jgi:hypothetical protein